VPVEAQASGRPVIAFAKGGALETVLAPHPGRAVFPEQATGVLFPHQSVDSLMDAIAQFEGAEHSFSPRFIRRHAEQFDKQHFLRKMTDFVV
jgi:glycosyltransferase involved in cell wall biosynthesis